MPDSLQHTLDTIASINSDSLLLVSDSLKVRDSVALADSLKSILPPLPSGIEGIALPSLPETENWVFIVIAVLFFFLITGIIQSAGTLVQSFKSFFSRKETINIIGAPTANIAQFQVLITIFTIAVFALTAYEFNFFPPQKFSFSTFLLFMLLFAGFYSLKYILFEIVGNTFFNKRTTRSYKKLYFSLLNILAMMFFPVLILNTYLPATWSELLLIISYILIVIFYIFLIIKFFQIFYTKPIALFYIFLYLCTLEILPILTLIRVSQKFI